MRLRVAAATFACVLAAALSPASGAYAQTSEGDIVVAQFDVFRGPPVFRFLTRPFRREEGTPPPEAAPREGPSEARPQRQRSAAPRQQRRTRQAPARRAAPEPAPEVVEVEKADDARRILVVGDFMAGALAEGLEEAFADNPDIVVVDASNGSSGLVRADFYDWPAELPAIVAEQRPAAILAMIGGNDRQAIDTATGTHVQGTEGWRAAYAARVGAFADALRATEKPVLWAGLVPVRSGAMSRDYSAFNGIFREQLEAKGMRFVETWNGFADAEGRFVASGPDVSGQPTQLRSSDGINFTRAGRRKLAYFVEQELREILGEAGPAVAAAAAAEDGPPLAPDDAARIGPMVPIEALRTGGETLSDGGGGGGGAAGALIVERLGAKGGPPAGRVDDYSWTGASP
jgi:hypothetical protein